MAVRNCALVVGACIIAAAAAQRTYGQIPGRDLNPQQVLLLADTAGALCTGMAADPSKRSYQMEYGDNVRPQVTDLLEKMQRTEEHPGWLKFILNRNQVDFLVRETANAGFMNREACHRHLAQLIIDTIYCAQGRAQWCTRKGHAAVPR